MEWHHLSRHSWESLVAMYQRGLFSWPTPSTSPSSHLSSSLLELWGHQHPSWARGELPVWVISLCFQFLRGGEDGLKQRSGSKVLKFKFYWIDQITWSKKILVNFVENLVYFKKMFNWYSPMNSQISLLFEFVATSPNKLVSIYNKW